MTKNQSSNDAERTCPSCGEQLHRDGELLRCSQHGLFFAYGPRLLVHIPHPEAAPATLLPWQTLSERAVG